MARRGKDAREVLRRLQVIPGVGPSIAKDLLDLGISRVEDLRDRSPEELYEAHCALVGHAVDRCLLYVFRCAVYFATEARHDPEKLKWWNWKDDGRRARRIRPKMGGPQGSKSSTRSMAT